MHLNLYLIESLNSFSFVQLTTIQSNTIKYHPIPSIYPINYHPIPSNYLLSNTIQYHPSIHPINYHPKPSNYLLSSTIHSSNYYHPIPSNYLLSNTIQLTTIQLTTKGNCHLIKGKPNLSPEHHHCMGYDVIVYATYLSSSTVTAFVVLYL